MLSAAHFIHQLWEAATVKSACFSRQMKNVGSEEQSPAVISKLATVITKTLPVGFVTILIVNLLC